MKMEKVDESWNFTTGVAGEGGLRKKSIVVEMSILQVRGSDWCLRRKHGHRSITIIYKRIINNICIWSLDMYLAVLRLRQVLRKSDDIQFCETIMIRSYDKYWSKDGS